MSCFSAMSERRPPPPPPRPTTAAAAAEATSAASRRRRHRRDTPPPPRGMLAMLARPRADCRSRRPAGRHVHRAAAIAAATTVGCASPPRFAALARSPPPLPDCRPWRGRRRPWHDPPRRHDRHRSPARSPPRSPRTITCAVASTIAAARTLLSRTQHLLAITAAKIHPVRCAGPQIVVAEALLNVGVVVAHALAMRRIVLPAFPMLVGCGD